MMTGKPPPNRLQRSTLAVPGSQEALLSKAANSAADMILLDLEDAVAINDKTRAREQVVDAINTIDWGTKTVAVRLNGLDTPFMYRDLIAVAERCPRLDLLVIPKVNDAADLYTVDTLLGQIEMAVGRTRTIGLEALVETAAGLLRLPAIAAASSRLESICLGLGDLAASLQAQTEVIGGSNADYGVLAAGSGERAFFPTDMWHAAQFQILTACRAHGLRAIDGPYGDFSDAVAFSAAARRAAALGFDGKWVIHPTQIDTANRIFSPTTEAVHRAERVIAALAQSEQGGGSLNLDGKMIDQASVRLAERVLDKVDQIRRRHPYQELP